jgi:hypothetical protein
LRRCTVASNAVKAKTIRTAYFAYVKPFLRKPAEARFRVGIDGKLAVGEVKLAKTDLTRIKGDVSFRAHQRRAYNKLVRAVDSSLGPLLKFLPLS